MLETTAALILREAAALETFSVEPVLELAVFYCNC